MIQLHLGVFDAVWRSELLVDRELKYPDFDVKMHLSYHVYHGHMVVIVVIVEHVDVNVYVNGQTMIHQIHVYSHW